MKNSKVAVSWSPEDSSDIYEKTELFGDILTEYCPELIWINCKNAKDLRAKQMVREADLLILWLRQDSGHMEQYIAGARGVQKPVIYVICDYFESCSVNKKALIRKYRIKEECLCAIPYNPRMDCFSQRGMLKSYLAKGRIGHGPYEEYCGFFRELDETRRKLIQMLLRVSGK